jgi:hypothetical protein
MKKKKIGERFYNHYNDQKLAEMEKSLSFVNQIIEAGEQWTDPDF